MNTLTKVAVALVLVSGLVAAQAQAALSASFAEGDLAATATFAQSGNDLIVTLQNTATAGAVVPVNCLTGVYFSLSGVTLTPVKAVLGSGSTILHPETGTGLDVNGEVGGEFAYKTGISGVSSGADKGISSAGLGVYGPANLFPGTNLSGPASPDGEQYAIVNGIAANANSHVTGSPLIDDEVIFTLAGLPTGFDLGQHLDLSKVMFQYGTAFDPVGDNHLVPVPGAMVLGAIGLGLVGMWRRQKA